MHETITVRAEGARIIHGILRDLPRRRGTESATWRTPCEIVAVRRNGLTEPWRGETNIPDVLRLRIGSAQVLLTAGEQRYEIVYRGAQVRGFAAHDQLCWNVTGPAALLADLGGQETILGTIAAAALLGGAFWVAWWRIGRDPPARAIVPSFEPPAGISAAAPASCASCATTTGCWRSA